MTAYRLLPALLLAALGVVGPASAQSDGVPASTNVPGAQYPRITSDMRVIFRIKAPDAQKVEFAFYTPKRFPATKDEMGFWTATSDPVVPGFHYYRVFIDGAELNDPASHTFYGTGKDASGIEVPEKDADYYLPKDVPHGEVRERWYLSKTTGAWRRVYIYTPPGYDSQRKARYPVLYLQHGSGEDERGWSNQGRAAFIMDNLIADRKAAPMLVVMERGYATRAGEMPSANPGRGFSAFEDVVTKDLIPFIDGAYRTRADRDHRALAGLSMGGFQAYAIGLNHLDLFSAIGGFSGAGGGFGGTPFDPKTAYNGVMADPEAFKKRVRLLFLSIGTAENPRFQESLHGFNDTLNKAGIKTVFYESPGTDHEWLTWRRSLHEFAPLLFRTKATAGK